MPAQWYLATAMYVFVFLVMLCIWVQACLPVLLKEKNDDDTSRL